jgi:hypothetical protein
MKVKPMKTLRYILAVLAVFALTTSLAMPVLASIADKPVKSMELVRKNRGDDPWDPGDESASMKTPVPDGFSWEFQLARRSDDPWDPGDESGSGMGVCRA